MKFKVICAIIAAFGLIPNTAYMESTLDESTEAARQAAESNVSEKVEINVDEPTEKVDDVTTRAVDTFELKGIKIESDIKIQQKQVQHIIDPYINTYVGISELRKIAFDIKEFCRNKGYLAAVAYLPEQDSSDGVIQINITTAKFNKVIYNNESRLADSILNEISQNISSDQPVESKRIEDILYRINELGGTKARGTLVPDTASRGIDVDINVTNDRQNRGIIYTENYGSKYSGRYRLGLLYDLYNFDKHASNLEVSGIISNEDLDNYVIDYSFLIDRQSTSRLGLSFGRSSYHLTGGQYSNDLDAGGDSNDYKVYGHTPIFKSIHTGIDWIYGYRYKDVKNKINYLGMLTRISDIDVHTLYTGISGYRRINKALMNYSFTLYSGDVKGRPEFSGLLNGSGESTTEGHFNKSQLKIDYRQAFDQRLEFHTDFTLQNASKDLENVEKLYLGGASGVRGYADGDASGDEGYLSKTEIIYHTKLEGLSFSVFFDLGGSGTKTEDDIHTIRSYGLEVNYAKPNDFFLKADFARKWGNNKIVASDNKRNRIWFMAGKIF